MPLMPLLTRHLPMTITTPDLDHITHTTLAHYNERAADFWEGTREHDVQQNMAALLDHI